ncbi:MAG: amidohydrolase family protein [Pseudomonadota bacterium]
MIIDAHQHFWSLDAPWRAWPTPDLQAIYRDFGPSDLVPLITEAQVTGSVLVQAAPDVRETAAMLSIAQQKDPILGVVGWVPFAEPDNAIACLAKFSADLHFKGVRPMLQDMDDAYWILNKEHAPIFEDLISRRLTFDALIRPRHLPAIAVLAERYPTLPIVLNHAAKPDMASGEREPWASDIARFSDLRNVSCKLSGLLTEAAPGQQLADIALYTDVCLAVFGSSRLIWGSDWPVLNLRGSYRRWLEQARTLMAALDDQAQTDVFGANAQRFYKLTQENNA